MAFSTSLSGVNAAQQTMDVVSNNIVNAGTIGFKKGETEFAEIYASSLQDSGQGAGQGVALTTIRSDFSQGEFSFTTSALDLPSMVAACSFSTMVMGRFIPERAHFASMEKATW